MTVDCNCSLCGMKGFLHLIVPKDRFRGMFGFSEERCIVCHSCAKACPISIIYIQDHFEEIEVDGKRRKKKVLDSYDIDVKRCMFCGLCEEACPTNPRSIWLATKTYELGVYERNEGLYLDKSKLTKWNENVKPFPGVDPDKAPVNPAKEK